jgi:SAM-dependent methyltransferase
VSHHNSTDTEALREKWDGRANGYDEYYESFKGAVEHYVDWELLKRHLPLNRDARMLDSAGGTGRMTLPLAKMGYRVTLCDVSSRMLHVARKKLIRAGVLDRVEISQCDIRQLPYPDECFDYALSWSGMLEAAGELIRVTKKGGTVSMIVANRCRGAIDLFAEDPASALELVGLRSDYIYYGGERYRAVNPDEAKRFLEAQGVRVLNTYAACGWMGMLAVPKEVQESTEWDQELFTCVTEMSLGLAEEACVQGMAQHLVVYGERI